MNRRPRALLVALILVFFGTFAASPAHAEEKPNDDVITSYLINATFAPDGSAEVTSEVTLDCKDTPCHGPYLVFTTRQAIEGEPDLWRDIVYSDIQVSSDTAPADLKMERQSGVLILRIGHPKITVTGSHTYTVKYHLSGMVNEHDPITGRSQISWTPIGSCS